MKEISIKRNSWHYVLASRVAEYTPRWDYNLDCATDDICRYRKHVLAAMFILTLFAAVIALIGTIFFHVVFGIVFSLIYGAWLFTVLGEATLLVLSITGAVTGGFHLVNKAIVAYRHHKAGRVVREKPIGFVKQAYKSWRDKYCVPVKFVDAE
jgi:hypothetical protein